MSIDPKLIDVVLPEESGYPADGEQVDTPERLREAFGSASREFPPELWVEPKDLRDFCADHDKKKLWGRYYLDRFTNQGSGTNPIDGTKGYGTHECTCHALVTCAEAAMNRQRRVNLGGPTTQKVITPENSLSIWYSCLSIYAEANPNEWGGSYLQKVIGIAVERGFLPDHVQPREYRFKHSLHGTCGGGNWNQSRGSWPRFERDFPEGWRETAIHLRPKEVVNPKNTAEFDSLLAHGYSIAVGRTGHSVPIIGIEWDGNRKLYPYRDSYNVIRYDSSAYYSSSYSILSMFTPDEKWLLG